MASVGISNRFELLDDERPAKAAKPAPAAAAAEPKPAKKENRKERAGKTEKRDRPRREGGRGRGRGGRGGRRGPRSDDGGDRAPRREFDRRSGTGRNDREKRSGSGKYNWGEKEEVITPEDTQVPVAETTAETPSNEVPEEKVEEEEEEDNTITYEQMLAQRAANAVESDRKKGRQVVNDDSKWQDAVPVNPKKSQDENSNAGPSKQQKGRKALTFDEFVTKKASGRGGRGRGRGRDNRRKGQDRVKLDDESAFPKLGQS